MVNGDRKPTAGDYNVVSSGSTADFPKGKSTRNGELRMFIMFYIV